MKKWAILDDNGNPCVILNDDKARQVLQSAPELRAEKVEVERYEEKE